MMSTADDDPNGVQYNDDNWFNLIMHINREVRSFKDYLKDNLRMDTRATYFDEWNEFYSAVCDEKLAIPDISYSRTTQYLFAEISTLEDYANEALKLIPPVRAMTRVTKVPNQRGAITVIYQSRETKYKDEQIEMHNTLRNMTPRQLPPSPSSLDTGIDSNLKAQIRELEDKMLEATRNLEDNFGPRLDDLEKDLPNTIATAVQKSFDKMMERTNNDMKELQSRVESAKDAMQSITGTIDEELVKAKRASDILSGDLKNADDRIEQLRQKAVTITNNTTDSSDKAIKEYLTAKADLKMEVMNAETYFNDKKDVLTEMIDECNSKLTKHERNEASDDTIKSRRQYKTFPDEYEIDGKLVTIRTKKFQEDKTEVPCESSQEVFTAYILLSHISHQYGIYITDVGDIEPWEMTNKYPPTCPLKEKHFESKETFLNAYNTMSLALATKLKTSVKFGVKFIAAKLAINEYSNDGYVMLYHLIKNVHPKLQRNKATKPNKPSFQGDINRYVLHYNNWRQYQLQRDPPHIYDDDEVADDFLQAVKQSQWSSKLMKGIDFVETKLDRWKNNDDDEFPPELTLEFIGHSLMVPYVETNTDPLESDTLSIRPRVRAYYPRGRSRTPSRNYGRDRQRSQSRERSQSNDSDRSTYVDCQICGSRHLQSTAGCPHLHRHHHIQKYLDKSHRSDIKKQLEVVDRARRERSQSRERSLSRDSRGSRQSRHSTDE